MSDMPRTTRSSSRGNGLIVAAASLPVIVAYAFMDARRRKGRTA